MKRIQKKNTQQPHRFEWLNPNVIVIFWASVHTIVYGMHMLYFMEDENQEEKK